MDLRDVVLERLLELREELEAVSLYLYENPETAFEEHESARYLGSFLEGRGFAVQERAYGVETAFVARAGDSGPEVVICAEYDGLPGVGQACGHNIIAASALGAGVALSEIAADLGIRVTVLGTPAEERFGGKVDLLEAGAFADAAMAMMIHPSTVDVVDPQVIAITELDVHFHGKASHASAYPERGINALDAFVQSYVNISTLRQSLLPTDKVHGIITHGGDAPNIIPDHTSSLWYVRSQTSSSLAELVDRVRACFEAAGTATGCTVEIERIGHPYDALASNPVLTELYAESSRRLGRPMMRGSTLPPNEAGSTDMGNVSQVVPSIHPMLDIHSLPAVNHQAEFAAHTITPDGNKAIHDGAAAMAWTVIGVAERDLWSHL